VRNFKDHILSEGAVISEALTRLNDIAPDSILFVINDKKELIGSLTDGDIRRGLIKGLDTHNSIIEFIQENTRYLVKGDHSFKDIIDLRSLGITIVPVLDTDRKVVNVVNFRQFRSYLPVDAVVMAGGRGSRLSPLTDNIPKPLLKVGNKPIIEHNIDQLRKYGIDDFWISVRYLGEQIEAYFKDGSAKGIQVEYVWENEPLGTIGAVSKVSNFVHDTVLITNSDILTDLDYEKFFIHFEEQEADLSIVSIPYQVNVPYAVLELEGGRVQSFKEKPSYTYFSNGGIYLVKKKALELIPENTFFNATDLMERMIDKGMKVISYPLRGYWLDVGKPEDFKKANEDIEYLKT